MQTLNQDIKNNDFKKVYLLFGEEAFLKKSYKNRLREAITQGDTMNYNYYEGKGINVNEIISLSDTMPFFADRRLILMEDSGWFKGGPGADEMCAYIENIPDTTCLLFVETEVDKRSRMYKAVKSMAILQNGASGQCPAWKMGSRNTGKKWKKDNWPDYGIFPGKNRR